MASYKQLQENPPVLEPVEVSITGLKEPLLIHVFTMDEISNIIEAVEGSDDEEKLRKQVIIFLEGASAKPTAEDCAGLSKLFAGYQVREIYTKAFKLNGLGPEALREAEKN